MRNSQENIQHICYGFEEGGELIGVDRTKRVKEARDEAKKEIDAYKKSKDDEFKKFESEVRLVAFFLSRIL